MHRSCWINIGYRNDSQDIILIHFMSKVKKGIWVIDKEKLISKGGWLLFHHQNIFGAPIRYRNSHSERIAHIVNRRLGNDQIFSHHYQCTYCENYCRGSSIFQDLSLSSSLFGRL